MAKRCSVTLKASGVPTSQRGKSMTTFFYLADAATNAEIVAAAEAIAGLQNGSITGISAQIEDRDTGGPYGAATANTGSDFARVVQANRATKHTLSYTLPLLKQNASDEDIEDVLESVVFNFLNADGEPCGQVVKVARSQVVDG